MIAASTVINTVAHSLTRPRVATCHRRRPATSPFSFPSRFAGGNFTGERRSARARAHGNRGENGKTCRGLSKERSRSRSRSECNNGRALIISESCRRARAPVCAVKTGEKKRIPTNKFYAATRRRAFKRAHSTVATLTAATPLEFRASARAPANQRPARHRPRLGRLRRCACCPPVCGAGYFTRLKNRVSFFIERF